MKTHPALTLIELLIVIGLIALISGMAVISFGNIRNKQALIASAEELKSIASRAHIYARESKDEKSWGLKSDSNNSYSLLSGKPGDSDTVRTYLLEVPTEIKNGHFEIWFDIGTGEASNDKNIILESPDGRKIEIEINKNGLINMNSL